MHLKYLKEDNRIPNTFTNAKLYAFAIVVYVFPLAYLMG